MAQERQRRELTPAQRAALDAGRRQFKPGQSGNPKGPKPGLRDLRELLEAAMQKRASSGKGTRLERMVIALAQKLEVADEKSLDLIMRRVWPVPLDVTVDLNLGLWAADSDELAAAVGRALDDREPAAPAANGHDRNGAEGVPSGAHSNGAGGVR